VLATFVLLFLMTGSVLVPLKALLMKRGLARRLVRGAVCGCSSRATWKSLLGFTSPAASRRRSRRWVLAFGFGLAMDYEVFLLSRIKEARDAGAGNDESVGGGACSGRAGSSRPRR
jgi:RND superfamily putative drug exporter